MSSGGIEQARAPREGRPRGTAVAADATSRLDALSRTVPGLAMLRSYRPTLFGKDLVAGLVLTTLLVPQGMAYAELAGLPAITGLYTTILALLGYALFGPVPGARSRPGLIARPDDCCDRRSAGVD